MPGAPQRSKKIDIRRLTRIVDKRMDNAQPAYEFSNHTIYKKPNKPESDIDNRYTRKPD